MRIVHLLSQTHLTGAEAHAVLLAEGLRADGHAVTLISDRLHLNTRAAFISRPIHSAKGLMRWREIFWLRRWLKENQIDLVHAHSRAAVRIAWWATRGRSTALVSTVHGRQHPSIGKRLFDFYGERVLAVCGHLKSQLVRDLKMRDSRITVIGNPVDLPEQPIQLTPTLKWLLVTRWTGPKGKRSIELLQNALPVHLDTHPNLRVDVIGEPPEKGSRAEKVFDHLENRFPGRVRHLGFMDPMEPEIIKYGLVLGGGRVAIAAVGSGVPCFAFGEAETLGLIRQEKWKRCLDSNFGDILPGVIDADLDLMVAKRDLDDFLGGRGPALAERLTLAHEARESFGFAEVLKKIVAVYQSARLLKKHPHPIPVLMYHMIVSQEIKTPHRTFVTEKTFRRHLQAFRCRGMTTIGFQDLLDFKEGRRPLTAFPRRPLILTFDDGYQNNLTLAKPLLEEFGLKAVIFLLAKNDLKFNEWDEGASPQIQLLSPNERQVLSKAACFEIASHGLNHDRLPIMNDEQSLQELRNSKKMLEQEFDRPIRSFAFTYGDIDDRSARLAQQSGYDYAINTDRGAILLEENPWSVFRVNVFPEDGFFSILKKTSPSYRWRYFKKRGR